MTLSSKANPVFASALAADGDAALVRSVHGILEELAAVKNSWPGDQVNIDVDASSHLSAAESGMLANESNSRMKVLLATAIGNELGSLRDRFLSSRPITEYDIPADEGFLRKVGVGAYTLHKSNLSAFVDPTVTDDVTKGYGLGSPWINKTDDGFFLLANPNQGQAVWVEVASSAVVASHVVGPTSATDNAVCRFDATTGKLIQNSSVIIDDSDNVSGIGNLDLSGTVDGKDVSTLIANLVEDTTPELSGDLKLAATGVSTRLFTFNHASLATLTVQNVGAGAAALIVDGPIQAIGSLRGDNIWATTSLLVGTTSVLRGNVTIGDGTAVDRTLTFNASANDGIITWDEDPGQFLFSHAIVVTGNINVSGTVDGRDLQTDGTKLDGIESNATADQSDAEIKTAYENNADTNAFDDAEQTKLAGIEAAADVTDATNVNAAGAVMETDYNANTLLAATSDNTPVTLTVGEQTLVGRITAGNIAALTAAQVRTLINVEDNADVTDGANVASAGAAMLDSNGTVTGVWTRGTNTKLQFRDAGIFLNSNVDGELTIDADVKVNIPADTDITGELTVTGALTVDSIRLNGDVIQPPTTGHLIITGGTGGGDTLKLGRTGSDAVFGTSTSQDAVPHADLMFDFGTTTKRFGHGFFGHGVRTKSKTTAVNFGAAPSNAELDTEFGTEAVLGDGFVGLIEDDTGGTGEPWLCWVVNAQWVYLKGTFAL